MPYAYPRATPGLPDLETIKARLGKHNMTGPETRETEIHFIYFTFFMSLFLLIAVHCNVYIS